MTILTAGNWYLAEISDLASNGGATGVSQEQAALLVKQAAEVSQNSARLHLHALAIWRKRLGQQIDTRRELAVARGTWDSWIRISGAKVLLRVSFVLRRVSARLDGTVRRLLSLSDGIPDLRQE